MTRTRPRQALGNARPTAQSYTHRIRSKLPLLAALLVSLFVAPALLPAAPKLPPPRSADPNPWNGTWQLDVKRSSPAAADPGVPQAYRLTPGPGGSGVTAIKWEIPELGEVVTGQTDGPPMPIHRTKPACGLALGVSAEGPAVLLYHVYRDGKRQGGGRMMLVDNGQSWVDLT